MSTMRENLHPGPKPSPRPAKDGTLCPPGSEGTRVYRGERPFHQVCRNGHPKPHPGRCVPCRRASDSARDAKRKRKAQKRAAVIKWSGKPENKIKISTAAKRRNARQEQKDAAAARMRQYRREAPPAHRAHWIRHRGPIPKTHVIVFNGVGRVVRLRNLEMISRREMMARNTIQRFPAELRKTIWALRDLKKTIRRSDERN